MTPNSNLPTAATTATEFTDEDLVNPDGGLFGSEFWAVARHELIADTAELMLKQHTADRLKVVLKPLADQGFATGLADLAGWADTTKRRAPRDDDDEDTVAFLQDPANKSRAIWHYVDLPLASEAYSRELYPTLTGDEDVVQMTKTAVSVLKGESDRFSQINALRLLVHLIGDLHQPVHVACGYVDESVDPPVLVTDPDVIVQEGFEDDQGGGHILLPIGNNGTGLHGYWDSRLGGSNPDLGGGEGDAVDVSPALKKAFTQKLLNMIAADPQPASDPAAEGDATSIDDWIVDWANDSLLAAREAYKSLVITEKSGQNFKVDWEGRDAYDARCKPIALDRMKTAARNLAKVLDEIYA